MTVLQVGLAIVEIIFYLFVIVYIVRRWKD